MEASQYRLRTLEQHTLIWLVKGVRMPLRPATPDDIPGIIDDPAASHGDVDEPLAWCPQWVRQARCLAYHDSPSHQS